MLLARLIRGTPDAPGWASTDDGHAMFKWLVKYGSTSDDASQELLITEFAVVMCESRLTKQGLARTQIVFKHAQYAEDVIARLTEIMDIYERVPEQRACPARMFVKVMVNLLAEDVPLLRDWASRLAIDIQTGKISLADTTRSDWVGGEASTMIRALLPLRASLHQHPLRPGARRRHPSPPAWRSFQCSPRWIRLPPGHLSTRPPVQLGARPTVHLMVVRR